jgi:hypothetical protein
LGLIDRALLLVMTTCVIGPVLTARFAKTLKQESSSAAGKCEKSGLAAFSMMGRA